MFVISSEPHVQRPSPSSLGQLSWVLNHPSFFSSPNFHKGKPTEAGLQRIFPHVPSFELPRCEQGFGLQALLAGLASLVLARGTFLAREERRWWAL